MPFWQAVGTRAARQLAGRGLRRLAPQPPIALRESAYSTKELRKCNEDSQGVPTVILTGTQTSGTAHLGNYAGSFEPFLRLQATAVAGPKLLYFLADLHALTSRPDPTALQESTRELACTLLACGLDVKKTILFKQSAVHEHAELMWILSTLTPMGWLGRMIQWKERRKVSADATDSGVYFYPVLMAADILLYRTTHVPVGEDQVQHLELARNLADRFHTLYKCSLFPNPHCLTGKFGSCSLFLV